jgi:hypothetical protein
MKSNWFFFAFAMITISRIRPNYAYEEGIRRYMDETHDLNFSKIDNSIFYFLELSGCDPCVQQNITLIEKNIRVDLVPVFIGETLNAEWINIISTVSQANQKALFDKENKARFYELGMGKPLLIHVKKGEIVYFKAIKDSMLDEVQSYLDEN